MTKQIDVLVVEPGQAPCLTKVENELEAFEKIIGAPVDVGCYLPQRVMLVCRENAKHDGYIAGKFLLCGLGEDGFDSLTPAQQLEFQEKFSEWGGVTV